MTEKNGVGRKGLGGELAKRLKNQEKGPQGTDGSS